VVTVHLQRGITVIAADLLNHNHLPRLRKPRRIPIMRKALLSIVTVAIAAAALAPTMADARPWHRHHHQWHHWHHRHHR